MTEIKFRVWLKPEHWNEDEHKGLMTNGLPLGGFNEWWINLENPFNENCGLDGTFTAGKEIEVMQFTGLNDKKGKEIYEGDILNSSEKDSLCYVIWDDAAFALKSPGSEAVDYEHSSVFESMEVVGNIYENPELLKQKL